MKKHSIRLLTCVLLSVFLLTGCGKTREFTEEDFTYSSDKTSAGIGAGDDFAALAAAYSDFTMETMDTDGNITAYSFPDLEEDPEAVPDSIILMTSSFFIDGSAVSVPNLCEQLGVSSDELVDTLKSSDYLSAHSVVFRYMIFNITDGCVSSISSDYLDYNSEL